MRKDFLLITMFLFVVLSSSFASPLNISLEIDAPNSTFIGEEIPINLKVIAEGLPILSYQGEAAVILPNGSMQTILLEDTITGKQTGTITLGQRGTYTVLAQAHIGDIDISSQHNITVNAKTKSYDIAFTSYDNNTLKGKVSVNTIFGNQSTNSTLIIYDEYNQPFTMCPITICENCTISCQTFLEKTKIYRATNYDQEWTILPARITPHKNISDIHIISQTKESSTLSPHNTELFSNTRVGTITNGHIQPAFFTFMGTTPVVFHEEIPDAIIFYNETHYGEAYNVEITQNVTVEQPTIIENKIVEEHTSVENNTNTTYHKGITGIKREGSFATVFFNQSNEYLVTLTSNNNIIDSYLLQAKENHTLIIPENQSFTITVNNTHEEKTYWGSTQWYITNATEREIAPITEFTGKTVSNHIVKISTAKHIDSLHILYEEKEIPYHYANGIVTVTIPRLAAQHASELHLYYTISNTSKELGVTPIQDIIIIDNNDVEHVTTKGKWLKSSNVKERYKSDYLIDMGVAKGEKTISYQPLVEGKYEISIYAPTDESFSTNTPITIEHKNGKDTITSNQQQEKDWKYVGAYDLTTNSKIIISTEGTNGIVVADAVKLVKVNTYTKGRTEKEIKENITINETEKAYHITSNKHTIDVLPYATKDVKIYAQQNNKILTIENNTITTTKTNTITIPKTTIKANITKTNKQEVQTTLHKEGKTHNISLRTEKGTLQETAYVEARTIPKTPAEFKYELLDFIVENTNETTIELTYPEPIPEDAEYYKFNPNNNTWYTYPFTKINDHTITITLVDGGIGDDDGEVNGRITDPGGLAGTWTNSSWTYRQNITVVNNVALNLTNYTVTLNLTNTTVDGNFSWTDDYDALRFYQFNGSTETELGYYIESWNSGAETATILVKLENLPSSATDNGLGLGTSIITMYYGNTAVSTTSNISEAYLWYDDFNDNSLLSTYGTHDADLVAGTAFNELGGELIIDAGGADIWTGNDEYGVVYLPMMLENFEAIVEVTSQESADLWSKSGIVVRNNVTQATTATGYAVVATTPGNGYTFQYDNANNGYLDSNVEAGSVTLPSYIRLIRDGSTYYAYYSTDGSTWNSISNTILTSDNVQQQVGLIVTSHAGATLSEVHFDNFIVQPYVATTPTITYLPQTTHVINPTINTPTNNSYLNQTSAWFNYTTEGNYTHYCWYSMDGGANSSAGSCNGSFGNLAISEGKHNWTLYANNTFGFIEETTHSFTRDTQTPLINITYPLQNVTHPTLLLDLNYTVSDINDMVCWYSLNGGIINSSPGTCTNFTQRAGIQGNNTWTVYVEDESGKTNSSTVNFTINQTELGVVINSPENITYHAQTTKNITFGYAGLNIDSCWYSTDKGITNNSIETCDGIFENVPVTTGINTWTVYINDSTGNTTNNTLVFRNDYPTIDIQIPQNGFIYGTSTLDLNYTYTSAVAPQSCWYSLDGGTTNSSSGSCNNFTGLTTTNISNTWTVYMRFSDGYEIYDTTSFLVNAISYPTNWYDNNYDFRKEILFTEPNVVGVGDRTETHVLFNTSFETQRVANTSSIILVCSGTRVPLDAYSLNTSGSWITGIEALAEINITAAETKTCYLYYDPITTATPYIPSNTGWSYVAGEGITGNPVVDLGSGQITCSGEDEDGEYLASPCGAAADYKINQWCYFQGQTTGSQTFWRDSDDCSELNIGSTLVADGCYGEQDTGTYTTTSGQYYEMAVPHSQGNGGQYLYMALGAVNDNNIDTECYPYYGDEWEINTNISGEKVYPIILINISEPSNATYNTNATRDLNYTYDARSVESCWYSTGSNFSTAGSCTNFTGLPVEEGNNTWTVFLQNTEGRINSSNITFFVDSIAPNISITTPQNTTYNTLAVNLEYNYIESNPSQCWYSTNGGVTNSSKETCDGSFSGIIADIGSNNWTVWMEDILGHSSSDTVFFTTNATLAILNSYPVEGEYYDNTTLWLNYTYAGNNLDSCWYSKDGGTTNSTTATCNESFGMVSGNEGSNTWTLYINNTNGTEYSDTVTFSIDSIAPIINITSPQNTSTQYQTILPLEFSISDTTTVTCWYSTDGGTTNSSPTSCSNYTSISANIGNNTWTIYGEDSAGNVNSDSTTFTVDPSPYILSTTLTSTSGKDLTTDNLTCSYVENSFTENSIVSWSINNTPHMVAYAPMEGSNADDYSGSGNDGTITGATWNESSGYDGYGAYDFDDVNAGDIISFPTTGMNVNSGTVSIWANMDAASGARSYIFSHRTGADANRAYIYEEAGTLFIGFADVFSNNIGYTITPDTWHNYVLTWTGPTWTIYVDGVNQTSGSSATLSGIDGTMYLGSYVGTQEWFDGHLDELRVYNYTLSQEEITSIYNNETNIILSSQTSMDDLWQCNVTAFNRSTTGLSTASNTILISPEMDIVLNITNPINSSVENSASVWFNYTSLGSNIDSCWYSLDGGITNSSGGSCNGSFGLVTGPNGNNNWTLYANDTYGKENSTSVTFTILEHDVGISELYTTTGENCTFDSVNEIIATVHNYGGTVSNVTVEILVNNTLIDNTTISSLAAGANTNVSFSYFGGIEGTYNISIRTNLSSDYDTSNDEKNISIEKYNYNLTLDVERNGIGQDSYQYNYTVQNHVACGAYNINTYYVSPTNMNITSSSVSTSNSTSIGGLYDTSYAWEFNVSSSGTWNMNFIVNGTGEYLLSNDVSGLST